MTQIELQRRFDSSNTLTFLALLYVPLSFVTVSVLSRVLCTPLIRIQSFMAMLLTDPSTTPAPQTLNTSDLVPSQSSNMTYNTSLPAPSPGPRLWDLKTFAYLACPLLFGTIIMPLISGILLRYMVKGYVHLMPWSNLAFALLWLLGLICFNTLQNFLPGTLRYCLDATIIAVVIYLTYRAFLRKVRRRLYSFLLIAVLACFVLEWFVRGFPTLLSGYVAWASFVAVWLYKLGLGRFIGELFRKKIESQAAEL